ncbi:hypothetical protein K8T06_18370 [bacterium]|nr:hypothetical protein [bacterium]
MKNFSIAICLLILITCAGSIQAQTTLFWDAQIPEYADKDIIAGLFFSETILGDVMLLPVRIEIPNSEKVSWFIQGNYLTVDVAGIIDVSTYEIGCGFSYQHKDEQKSFPFNVCSRFGVTYTKEKIKEFEVFGIPATATIHSDILIEGAIGASKTYSFQSLDAIPYTSFALGFITDDSEFLTTVNLGSRFKFQNNWSFYAELAIGDRDGFAVGASMVL